MDILQKTSEKLTYLIGTPLSIVIHTLLFAGVFVLVSFGVSVDDVLLILTTAVSLEAIYLAIFIQMSVNRTTHHIAVVREDIEDIQEDVEDIQEDVDSLEVSAQGEDKDDDGVVQALTDIEKRLGDLQKDIALLKRKGLF